MSIERYKCKKCYDRGYLSDIFEMKDNGEGKKEWTPTGKRVPCPGKEHRKKAVKEEE